MRAVLAATLVTLTTLGACAPDKPRPRAPTPPPAAPTASAPVAATTQPDSAPTFVTTVRRFHLYASVVSRRSDRLTVKPFLSTSKDASPNIGEQAELQRTDDSAGSPEHWLPLAQVSIESVAGSGELTLLVDGAAMKLPETRRQLLTANRVRLQIDRVATP